MASERVDTELPDRLVPTGLRGRLRDAAARAIAESYRSQGRLAASRKQTRRAVIVLASCFAMFVLLGLLVVAALDGDPDQPVAGTVFGVCALVIVAAAVLTWAQRTRARRRWPRLDVFARANGLRYLPEVGYPRLPGVIFRFGWDRIATDVVRTPRGRIEFGNYSCNALAQSRSLTSWGYIAIRLAAPLPNIVLRAKRGSQLPLDPDESQRLGLEGDFDRHFTLYCPKEYERDALYLFTPDVMARFIDRAGGWDVEIVDDRLFLYRHRDAVTLDPAEWERVRSVAQAVAEKTVRWARWREEHPRPAPDPSALRPVATDLAPGTPVAPGGRRLVGGRVLYVVGTITVIAIAVLVPRIIELLNR